MNRATFSTAEFSCEVRYNPDDLNLQYDRIKIRGETQEEYDRRPNSYWRRLMCMSKPAREEPEYIMGRVWYKSLKLTVALCDIRYFSDWHNTLLDARLSLVDKKRDFKLEDEYIIERISGAMPNIIFDNSEVSIVYDYRKSDISLNCGNVIL